eukprot:5237962-Alexandrium_andersonii.AAC.1
MYRTLLWKFHPCTGQFGPLDIHALGSLWLLLKFLAEKGADNSSAPLKPGPSPSLPADPALETPAQRRARIRLDQLRRQQESYPLQASCVQWNRMAA